MKKIKLTLEDINKIANRVMEFDDTYEDALLDVAPKGKSRTMNWSLDYHYKIIDLAKTKRLVSHIKTLINDKKFDELKKIALFLGESHENIFTR